MKIDKRLKSASIAAVLLVNGMVVAAPGVYAAGTKEKPVEQSAFLAKKSFGGVQGTEGWYYMEKSNGSYAYLSRYESGKKDLWEDADGQTQIGKDSFQPGNGSAAVKKWIAPEAGTVDISGAVRLADRHGGAVVTEIMLNTTTLWHQTVDNKGNVKPDGVTGIHVEAGDALYFIVDAVGEGGAGDDGRGEVTWSPEIALTTAFTIQAEKFNQRSGVDTQATGDADGGKDVTGFDAGDYMVYKHVDLGGGYKTLEARLSAPITGSAFEVRLDGPSGPVISTFTVANTGSWQSDGTQTYGYETQVWGVDPSAKGVHDLYVRALSGSGIATINWFRFTSGETRGATMPFRTYEAENGVAGGSAARDQDPDVKVASSGKSYVQLNQPGDSVEWAGVRDANRMMLRYSIPQGTSGTLSLYVNGVKRQALTLSSTYNYDADNASYKRRYDDKDIVIDINAGDTIRLQKDAGDTLPWYGVDLIELETAPAPLAMPVGYLNVKDAPFSAVGDGVADDTAAIQAAVNAAAAHGTGVWFPAGTYNQSAKLAVPSGVDIRGAGIWYSHLHATVSNDVWGGTVGFTLNDDTTISDLRISGVQTQRANQYAIVVLTNPGTGHRNVLQNLWVEHVGCLEGWTDWVDSTIENTRIRNTYFDGIHWGDGGNNGNEARNNFMRGLGDDGVAQVNLRNFNAIANHNVAEFNTISASYWGRGMSDVGGSSLIYRDNIIDSSFNAGMIITTEPVGDPAKNELSVPIDGLKFQRNTIDNAGHAGHNHAGLHYWLYVAPMKDVRIELNTIENGETEGIHIDNTDYGDDEGRTQFNYNTVRDNALDNYDNASLIIAPVLKGNVGFDNNAQ